MSRKPRDGRRARLLSKWLRDLRGWRTQSASSWRRFLKRPKRKCGDIRTTHAMGRSSLSVSACCMRTGERNGLRERSTWLERLSGVTIVADVISILWFKGSSFNHSPSYTTTPFRSNWTHPSHTAYHPIHHHPNGCLLQFSTILEHFGSQVHKHFTYRATIEISSIISHSKPEITQFHDTTLTKQQIVRFDVLSFSNTSTTYSMNHTSHIKMKQAW